MKKLRVQFYRDAAGEWRWRAFSRNRRIVADSGEGYSRRAAAARGAAAAAAALRFDLSDAAKTQKRPARKLAK